LKSFIIGVSSSSAFGFFELKLQYHARGLFVN
jgi:hypothetical protein